MRKSIFAALAFLFVCVSLSAQTLVTGTFLTPQNQTPSQAGLSVYTTINGTPVCGRIYFAPFDNNGNRVIRLVWNGVTYFPQQTLAYIRCSDGVMINTSGTAGVSLVPNSDAQPANTTYQLNGSLDGSTNGLIPTQAWQENKSVPDQPSIDWSTLPVAQITAPVFAVVYGTGSVNMDLENPATTDTGTFQWEPKNPINIKRLSCSVDVGTVSINFDIRTEAAPNSTGASVLSAPLVCSPTTGSTTSFSTALIPGASPVALDITAISGTPGIVRVHAEY